MISDEEFDAEGEKEEEDRKVERIYNESCNTQQKLLIGTKIDIVCVYVCMYVCQYSQSKEYRKQYIQ